MLCRCAPTPIFFMIHAFAVACTAASTTSTEWWLGKLAWLPSWLTWAPKTDAKDLMLDGYGNENWGFFKHLELKLSFRSIKNITYFLDLYKLKNSIHPKYPNQTHTPNLRQGCILQHIAGLPRQNPRNLPGCHGAQEGYRGDAGLHLLDLSSEAVKRIKNWDKKNRQKQQKCNQVTVSEIEDRPSPKLSSRFGGL